MINLSLLCLKDMLSRHSAVQDRGGSMGEGGGGAQQFSRLPPLGAIYLSAPPLP